MRLRFSDFRKHLECLLQGERVKRAADGDVEDEAGPSKRARVETAPGEEDGAEDGAVQGAAEDDDDDDENVYLPVSLGAIYSILFVLLRWFLCLIY